MSAYHHLYITSNKVHRNMLLNVKLLLRIIISKDKIIIFIFKNKSIKYDSPLDILFSVFFIH